MTAVQGPISAICLGNPVDIGSEEDLNLMKFFKKFSKSCPEALLHLKFVETLTSFQAVDSIRTWLKQNDQLLLEIKKLDLQSCGLTRIPDEIRLFRNLYLLDVSQNPFVDLTAVGSLRLRKINIMGNHLSTLPPFMKELDTACIKGNHFGLGKEMDTRHYYITRRILKEECQSLAVLTPLTHGVATLVNVAYRVIKLITFSHFWIPIYQKVPYHFEVQLKEFAYDLVRVVAAPILLLVLEGAAFYGMQEPYDGLILYGKLERAIYGINVMDIDAVRIIGSLTLLSGLVASTAYGLLKNGGHLYG